MQVLFLESSKNIGGQELQLLQQMQSLNTLGWATKLLCKQDARIADFAKSKKLDVQFIPFRNALHLPSIFSVIRVIKKFRPLAIICHSGHDAVVGAVAAKWVGLFGFRPKIIRMRTYQPGEPSSFTYNYLFDKTFTPSEYLKKKLLTNKNIKCSKIGVLYPGVNFSELIKATVELPDHLQGWLTSHPGHLITHGAMLRGEKGHEVILKALPSVIKVYPDVRYLVAGEGRTKNKLQELVIELGLLDHVYFCGMIQPISSLLRKTAIAVLPSLSEPLGMFQIESQYLEVPTIASHIDGIPETLIHQKTGLLVKPGSVDEWAQNIIWALSNMAQMQTWAKCGKAYVEDKFSLEKNAKELIEIING